MYMYFILPKKTLVLTFVMVNRLEFSDFRKESHQILSSDSDYTRGVPSLKTVSMFIRCKRQDDDINL